MQLKWEKSSWFYLYSIPLIGYPLIQLRINAPPAFYKANPRLFQDASKKRYKLDLILVINTRIFKFLGKLNSIFYVDQSKNALLCEA